ncbi:uncharacterized protein BDR25DRAFT_351690 [Lindgomyces ingoldianus]|uniref:Uncharacterized protein n=1 Tax=Lindgomyces ingoldianus TaxID=673940 RepID=A0ACB6R5V9_9PLEO|nr:uncharacterized protein BDR25DRAFT_351690 [Lindgomyces ingoldianus]KAF2474160.1 hypothetical protein BDR25DRAFT_351690 [Lindgomyces ingoldianus]
MISYLSNRRIEDDLQKEGGHVTVNLDMPRTLPGEPSAQPWAHDVPSRAPAHIYISSYEPLSLLKDSSINTILYPLLRFTLPASHYGRGRYGDPSDRIRATRDGMIRRIYVRTEHVTVTVHFVRTVSVPSPRFGYYTPSITFREIVKAGLADPLPSINVSWIDPPAYQCLVVLSATVYFVSGLSVSGLHTVVALSTEKYSSLTHGISHRVQLHAGLPTGRTTYERTEFVSRLWRAGGLRTLKSLSKGFNLSICLYDTYTYLSSSLSYERTQNLTRTGLKIAQSYSTTSRWKPWLHALRALRLSVCVKCLLEAIFARWSCPTQLYLPRDIFQYPVHVTIFTDITITVGANAKGFYNVHGVLVQPSHLVQSGLTIESALNISACSGFWQRGEVEKALIVSHYVGTEQKVSCSLSKVCALSVFMHGIGEHHCENFEPLKKAIQGIYHIIHGLSCIIARISGMFLDLATPQSSTVVSVPRAASPELYRIQLREGEVGSHNSLNPLLEFKGS